ncbi:hypothetical protein Tco_0424977 [Tanacetum coccineum]
MKMCLNRHMSIPVITGRVFCMHFCYLVWGCEVTVSGDTGIDTEFIAEIQGNKWLPTTADLDKMKFAHNNILMSQCKTGAEPTQVFEGCARDPNASIRYLFNKDLFFLKNGNIRAKKYILSLHKIHATSFPEDDLEELLKRWVRKVFTKFHVTSRLSTHHWKSNRARTYYWQCMCKTKPNPDKLFTNRKIIDIVKVRHHEVYGHEQIDDVIVKRINEKFYSFAKSDFKYLNKNDIEDMYYICLRRRIC